MKRLRVNSITGGTFNVTNPDKIKFWEKNKGTGITVKEYKVCPICKKQCINLKEHIKVKH